MGPDKQLLESPRGARDPGKQGAREASAGHTCPVGEESERTPPAQAPGAILSEGPCRGAGGVGSGRSWGLVPRVQPGSRQQLGTPTPHPDTELQVSLRCRRKRVGGVEVTGPRSYRNQEGNQISPERL